MGNQTAKGIRVFRLNDAAESFEELELDRDVKLRALLKPTVVLYFIEPALFRSFIWSGSQTSTHMKFIAAQKAPAIRDRIGPGIKVTSVDEGDESAPFKVMVGLETAPVVEEPQITSVTPELSADEILFQDLTLEKIILLLEKAGTPPGWKREMVLEGDNLYGYQMAYKEYLGEIIEERKLYPLQESISDGTYLKENLIPRFMFSKNKIILTEFFRKMTDGEIATAKANETKFWMLKSGSTPFKI